MLHLFKQSNHPLFNDWRNGAKIQLLAKSGEWKTIPKPRWTNQATYRIQPDCSYAINYILDNYGEQAVYKYQDWLANRKVILKNNKTNQLVLLPSIESIEDPFKFYMETLSKGYQISVSTKVINSKSINTSSIKSYNTFETNFNYQ